MCPSAGRLHEALKRDIQTARYAIQRTEGRGATLRTLSIGSLLRKLRDRYNLGRAADGKIEARIGLHGAASAQDQISTMEVFHELAH
jgi:hypothetical protein